MSETINTIVEGGMFENTPKRLMYCGIELIIPENVQILLSDHKIHPERYLLYAKTNGVSEFEILRNPYFECNRNYQDPNKFFSGGWPLKRFEPNFNWIFNARRSLTTRDGRIYIAAIYFEKKERSYLKAVPTILKDCREIFGGEKTEEYFNNNPHRTF